ncbi:MAG: hypothetical protein QGG48_12315 [Desulfatiglandales bacterium]|nr:hypothetical protein [Desulfatiglandales bacterium]
MKDHIDDLREDEDHDGVLAWFSVRALLEGIFERWVFQNLDDLKFWLDSHLNLLKAYRKKNTLGLVPRLFYHAMVLSDNSPMMKFVKKVELPEIRQKMKEWHPALLAKRMRELKILTR